MKPNITLKLHIFVLSVFATAQPLYDLLSKNTEFFPVRNNDAGDIFFLLFFLNVLIPAILIISVECCRLISHRVWLKAHVLVIFILASVIALPVLKQILYINNGFIFIFAIGFSAIFSYFYLKKQGVKLFISYLIPVIIIFPGFFIFNSPIYYLLFPVEIPVVEKTVVDSDVPIVMIVFDELPISSLMSARDTIDEKLFPGFSMLSDTSTWYVNATTVAEYTTHAMPALLTGMLPPEKLQEKQLKSNMKDWLNMPSFHQYPKNFFTALGESYDLRVFETVTSLCPETLCSQSYRYLPHRNQRLSELVEDLTIVYLHIILPAYITDKLPRIDMDWTDFVRNNSSVLKDVRKNDDVTQYGRFLDALTKADKPTLYFHHTTFPHGPWIYLPSGKEYLSSSYSSALNPSQIWDEKTDIREPYQRHLLQTMYADKLLSAAIIKLKKEGIFDEALIIVTSDHGASFMSGEKFREASNRNYADIADIPLFIKYPGQTTGSIQKSHARSIDIVPTIFNAIGSRYPWETDGNVLRDNDDIGITTLNLITKDRARKQFSYNANKKLATVKRKISLFGQAGINGIYGGKNYDYLIDKPVKTECSRRLSDVILEEGAEHFASLNLNTDKLPISVKFSRPQQPLSRREIMVITVNDRIASVLLPESVNSAQLSFDTLLYEKRLKTGKNTISAFIIDTTNDCYH